MTIDFNIKEIEILLESLKHSKNRLSKNYTNADKVIGIEELTKKINNNIFEIRTYIK